MGYACALLLATLIVLFPTSVGHGQFESKSYITITDPSGAVKNLCITDEALREKVRQVLLDGLDAALREQVENVFAVWMRDNASQPERAKVGIRKAMSAYLQARVGALNWAPPLCAGERPL